MIKVEPNPSKCQHPEILNDPRKSIEATGDHPCHNFCAHWDARLATCWNWEDDNDNE